MQSALAFAQTTSALVAPVLHEVHALVAATHDARHKLDLASIGRWLRVLLDVAEERWPDVRRVGREATAAVIAQVEQIDRELDHMEDRVSRGDLDWAIIRRHMLLASRRTRLVGLAVQLEDLVHALQGRGRPAT